MLTFPIGGPRENIFVILILGQIALFHVPGYDAAILVSESCLMILLIAELDGHDLHQKS